jgi:hypothetical protein
MDVQNASGVLARAAALQPSTAGGAQAAGAPAAAAAMAPADASRAIPPQPSLQPSALAQAVDLLQKQLSRQTPTVALTAGLDPDGTHPGQLLVELKDKVTQQVYVRYYIPPEQVAKVATQASDQSMPPGSLLQEKA